MDIYLYGCGGHAKVISDILCKQERKVTAFVDDNPPLGLTHIHGIPVKKNSPEILAEIECDRSQWIVAIGNNQIRRHIAKKLDNYGYSFTTAIHPSAQIGCGVEIASGTVIMSNSVINTDSKIGNHVIINTGATIDHDCIIEDYCHISPGCHLCGTVKLGKGVFLGVGSKVIPNIYIEEYTTCGAGSVVVTFLPSRCLAYGCPAKVVQTNYSE
ncbi:acetyltransferase [Calothrix sp. PCC 6303]|uniref:acetyltransferase n=1 Tax=Calothrix sp. PCC 6303 TaxID=1170562 RepID=UPI0002A03A0F|nr:acetyltransferase [Calothrix sp. PCC 6303]AFZ00165.1 sugar O-acyltransferase, sialic acid O-acetyltransferase NeuD family [Calothrix sp. PCC 6303]